MRIQKTESAEKLAQMAGTPFSKFSSALGKKLVETELVYDEDTFWGEPLHETMDVDAGISVLHDIIVSVGLEPTCEVVSLLFRDDIILMGDGDCPNCGGEMELEDATEVQTDPYSPPYYINEVYKCPHCGETK